MDKQQYIRALEIQLIDNQQTKKEAIDVLKQIEHTEKAIIKEIERVKKDKNDY